MTVDDVDAAILGRHGADTDLDRPCGVDQALAHGPCDEAAMRDAAVVGPCVLVCIEVHQRQTPVPGRVRLEQRIGDEVVAAEGEELRLALDDLPGLRRDRIGEALRLRVVEGRVAIIYHRQRRERVEAERVLRVAVEDRRGPADRRRPEPRARPV